MPQAVTGRGGGNPFSIEVRRGGDTGSIMVWTGDLPIPMFPLGPEIFGCRRRPALQSKKKRSEHRPARADRVFWMPELLPFGMGRPQAIIPTARSIGAAREGGFSGFHPDIPSFDQEKISLGSGPFAASALDSRGLHPCQRKYRAARAGFADHRLQRKRTGRRRRQCSPPRYCPGNHQVCDRRHQPAKRIVDRKESLPGLQNPISGSFGRFRRGPE